MRETWPKLKLIFQLNWLETAEEIDDLFLGDAEVCYLYIIILFIFKKKKKVSFNFFRLFFFVACVKFLINRAIIIYFPFLLSWETIYIHMHELFLYFRKCTSYIIVFCSDSTVCNTAYDLWTIELVFFPSPSLQ